MSFEIVELAHCGRAHAEADGHVGQIIALLDGIGRNGGRFFDDGNRLRRRIGGVGGLDILNLVESILDILLRFASNYLLLGRSCLLLDDRCGLDSYRWRDNLLGGDLQLLADLERVGREAVEFLELADVDAVAVCDRPERIARLDDVLLRRTSVWGVGLLLRLRLGERAFRNLLLADFNFAGELELLADADVVVLQVVEALDRIDRHVVLLGDLREIVAALHDVHRVLRLRRRKRLHVFLLNNLLLYDALAVGRTAQARHRMLRSGRARAVLLIDDDGSADRSGVRLDLRPDILHGSRLRRFALIVGILAAGDHSDRGNSENDAELVHFLFILLF